MFKYSNWLLTLITLIQNAMLVGSTNQPSNWTVPTSRIVTANQHNRAKNKSPTFQGWCYEHSSPYPTLALNQQPTGPTLPVWPVGGGRVNWFSSFVTGACGTTAMFYMYLYLTAIRLNMLQMNCTVLSTSVMILCCVYLIIQNVYYFHMVSRDRCERPMPYLTPSAQRWPLVYRALHQWSSFSPQSPVEPFPVVPLP